MNEFKYSTVCPYLVVSSVEDEMRFLVDVMGAIIKEEVKGAEGQVVHGEVQIGDSTVMIGKARDAVHARESMNYVFVDDVDKRYKLALQKGASSLQEPGDRYYGFRECGIQDPQGNQWWMGHQYEALSPEELDKRTKENR